MGASRPRVDLQKTKMELLLYYFVNLGFLIPILYYLLSPTLTRTRIKENQGR
jgi:hypothetical protein